MIHIRHAEVDDLEPLSEIHNHYILHSNATFDIEPRTAEQRMHWFHKFANTGPHQLLVALLDDVIVGYACSSRYREHFSFDQTVETSVYVSPMVMTKGIGSLLYLSLFDKLKSEAVHLAVVGIALPNEASILLHKKFGFEEVGVFKEYAVKNKEYMSSLWMQKKLGEA